VVIGWLRDCQRAAAAPGNALVAPSDPRRPVYVVEIGDGRGRFAHHFLGRFLDVHGRSVMKDAAVKYVLTSRVEEDVLKLCDHPSLRAFADAGHLDFARFDAAHDRAIRLVHSGEVLSGRAESGPVAVIALDLFGRAGGGSDIGVLRDLSGGQLLLLAADGGGPEASRDRPDESVQGSADFERDVLAHGGEILRVQRRRAGAHLAAFVLGHPPGGHVETRLSLRETMERRDPHCAEVLVNALAARHDALDLEELLAHLRASGWDAGVMLRCFPAIMARVEDADDALQEELCSAIHEVWRNHFDEGEARLLLLRLATLLHEMACYPDALEYYQRSIELHGPDAGTSFHMGMCHFRMRQMDAALRRMDEALATDPGFVAAEAMRIKIRSRSGRWGLFGPGCPGP
jgi:hypothetical protein